MIDQLKYLFVLVCILLFSVISQAHNEYGGTVHWGISPLAKGNLHASWTEPVLNTLRRRTGIEVNIASALNQQSFISNAIQGRYDVINCPTHIGLFLMHYHQYIPILRFKADSQIVVITHQQQLFSGIEDLHEYSLVTPGAISFAALKAEQYMGDKIRSDLIHYVDDHWEVAQKVVSKQVKVGALASIVYQHLSQAMKNELKVVHTFPSSGGSLVLVSPDMERDFISRLKLGLVDSNSNTLIHAAEPVYQRDIRMFMEQQKAYMEMVHDRLSKLVPK